MSVCDWIDLRVEKPPLQKLVVLWVGRYLVGKRIPHPKNSQYDLYVDGSSSLPTDKVTHWIPLPDPPKGQDRFD